MIPLEPSVRFISDCITWKTRSPLCLRYLEIILLRPRVVLGGFYHRSTHQMLSLSTKTFTNQLWFRNAFSSSSGTQQTSLSFFYPPLPFPPPPPAAPFCPSFPLPRSCSDSGRDSSGTKCEERSVERLALISCS